MALRTRTAEEVRILKEELRALSKTPIDVIAHKLGVHHETAEHLSAIVEAETRIWEKEA